MLRWIEKTRRKPKAVRDQYAFLGAIFATGFIVILWLVTLPATFQEISEGQEEGVESPGGAFSQFFTEAKSNFASVFSNQADTYEDGGLTTEQAPKAVVLPELSDETIATMEERQAEALAPEPRTILIATTSSPTASTTPGTSTPDL